MRILNGNETLLALSARLHTRDVRINALIADETAVENERQQRRERDARRKALAVPLSSGLVMRPIRVKPLPPVANARTLVRRSLVAQSARAWHVTK